MTLLDVVLFLPLVGLPHPADDSEDKPGRAVCRPRASRSSRSSFRSASSDPTGSTRRRRTVHDGRSVDLLAEIRYHVGSTASACGWCCSPHC